MDKRVEENINFLMEQIKSAKARRKHSVQMKVAQWDYVNNHPANVMIKLGMLSGGEGEKYFKKLGYSVDFVTTEKQATSKMIRDTLITKVKKLHTTNIIVRW